MKITNYPRKWKNKTNEKEFLVMPWWETIKNGEIEQVDELGQLLTEEAGKPCKLGVITQIGYLLRNEEGVWFGFGPSIEIQFDDLGEFIESQELK